MALYNQHQMIQALIEVHVHIKNELVTKYQNLSEEQLRHQPGPNKWNAIECFQHILITEEIYLKQYRVLIHQLKKNENEQYKSGFFGDYFVNSMEPKNDVIKNKMNTVKFMDPRRTDKAIPSANDETIKKMIIQRDEIIGFLEQCKELDIQKTKVKTALPLIKLRVGDSFRFITAHTQRHMLQAHKALATHPSN